MSGSLIKNAKKALKLFVKQLPNGSKFNIYSFGHNYTKFWNRSKVYEQDSVAEALQHIESMDADYGGTELDEVLKDIFERPDKSMKYRDVILLTDGAVSNTDYILEIVAENSQNFRVFSVGIGSGCSTALVNGVAEVSNGESTYVLGDDRIQTKIMELAASSWKDCIMLDEVSFGELEKYRTKTNLQKRINGVKNFLFKFENIDLPKVAPNAFKHSGIEVVLTFTLKDTQFEDVQYLKFDSLKEGLKDAPGVRAYLAQQEIRHLDKMAKSDWSVRSECEQKIIEASIKGNILHATTAFIGVSEKIVDQATLIEGQ